jgi:hypothetical protein
MRLVNDYWMRTYTIGNAGWRFAVYQMGNMATYNDTEDIRYKNYALRWARDINLWRKGTAVPYADNLACGQVYLDLFDLDPAPVPPIPIVGVRASAHDGNIP